MTAIMKSCYAELRWFAECCVCGKRDELPRGCRSNRGAYKEAVALGWQPTGKPWLLECQNCAALGDWVIEADQRAEREALRRAVNTPRAPHEPDLDRWATYELRKSAIERTSGSAEEYEERLARLVEEMNL